MFEMYQYHILCYVIDGLSINFYYDFKKLCFVVYFTYSTWITVSISPEWESTICCNLMRIAACCMICSMTVQSCEWRVRCHALPQIIVWAD
jgi:hypothetical protein